MSEVTDSQSEAAKKIIEEHQEDLSQELLGPLYRVRDKEMAFNCLDPVVQARQILQAANEFIE